MKTRYTDKHGVGPARHSGSGVAAATMLRMLDAAA